MSEYWRPIPGYEGIYDISKFGEIRCWMVRKGFPPHREKTDTPVPIKTIRRFNRGKGGWELLINLTDSESQKRQVMVKHLMRDIWMEGKKPGLVVRCIDGDQTNCSLYNLEYTTFKKVAKTIRKSNRVPIKKVNAKTREVIEFYSSIAEAARKNYLSERAVTLRIENKTVIDGVLFKRDR